MQKNFSKSVHQTAVTGVLQVKGMKTMQENDRQKEPVSADAREAVERYGDMLFRLCFVLLRNRQDAEDAVQDCFMRYLSKAPHFESGEHEKAWLLRVASNHCKNVLRFRHAHPSVSIEEIQPFSETESDREILTVLLALPCNYKTVLQLYYIEGYKTAEIASVLHLSLSTVKKRLEKGRKLLKEKYDLEDM